MPQLFKTRVKTTAGIRNVTKSKQKSINKNPLPVMRCVGAGEQCDFFVKWRIVGSVEGKRLSSTFTSYDISSSAADSVFCTLTGVPEQSSS